MTSKRPTSESGVTRAPSPREFTIVLRCAGERTASAAETILRSQVGSARPGRGASVHVIHERPFSAAVRRTFEIGIAENRRYTIGMDADVLLVRDGAAKLGHLAASLGPDDFTAVGLMLCRFFGGYCFRGIHVYRTPLLARAITMLGRATPDGPDPVLKPESAVVHAMAAAGHGFQSLPTVLAIHDYEQSLRHVYLKMRLRGRREAEHDRSGASLEAFKAYCSSPARNSHPDFTVALWGLDDGATDAVRGAAAGREEYNWTAPWPDFDRRMRETGLIEKPPLEAADGEEVIGLADRIIREHSLATDHRTPAWIREHLGSAPRRAA